MHRLKWTLKFTHLVGRLKICNSVWDLKFTSDISSFSLKYKEFICQKGLWLSLFRFIADLPDIQLLWIFLESNTQARLHAVQRTFREKEMKIYGKNNAEYTYSQTLFVVSWSKKASYTKQNSLVYWSSASGRKGISCMAYKALSWWPRTHLQVSEVKCCPWILQKQTCRILNFPNVHQLTEFTGNGSILYLLCMFLLGVWGTFQTHKIFQPAKLMITFERIPSPAFSFVPALKFASYKSRNVYGAKPLEKILFSLFLGEWGRG